MKLLVGDLLLISYIPVMFWIYFSSRERVVSQYLLLVLTGSILFFFKWPRKIFIFSNYFTNYSCHDASVIKKITSYTKT